MHPYSCAQPCTVLSYWKLTFLASSTGLSPSLVLCSKKLLLTRKPMTSTTTQLPHGSRFGLSCSPFDRLVLGNHYCFLFLRLLRCFSSPGSLSLLNNSDIFGSTNACFSPKLIAACHVLNQCSSLVITSWRNVAY